jgi:hypothetical protein
MSAADPLAETLALIESAPESASALTLYALVSTLEHRSAGCLFKLTKLLDLDAGHRALAYRLMDLLATGDIGGERWAAAKLRMDDLIRGSRR